MNVRSRDVGREITANTIGYDFVATPLFVKLPMALTLADKVPDDDVVRR